MNRIGVAVGRTLITLCLLMSAIEIAMGKDFIPYEDLEGTIWFSKTTHTRTTVDTNGNVEHKEGKEIYVQFLALKDKVYSVKVHWWNEQAKVNVVEYGVMIRHAENTYTYIEADHPEASDFPGIAGTGTFRLLNNSKADFSQIGRLIDGPASAFVTELHKVSAVPEIPIPQTYPKTQ